MKQSNKDGVLDSFYLKADAVVGRMYLDCLGNKLASLGIAMHAVTHFACSLIKKNVQNTNWRACNVYARKGGNHRDVITVPSLVLGLSKLDMYVKGSEIYLCKIHKLDRHGVHCPVQGSFTQYNLRIATKNNAGLLLEVYRVVSELPVPTAQ